MICLFCHIRAALPFVSTSVFVQPNCSTPLIWGALPVVLFPTAGRPSQSRSERKPKLWMKSIHNDLNFRLKCPITVTASSSATPASTVRMYCEKKKRKILFQCKVIRRRFLIFPHLLHFSVRTRSSSSFCHHAAFDSIDNLEKTLHFWPPGSSRCRVCLSHEEQNDDTWHTGTLAHTRTRTTSKRNSTAMNYMVRVYDGQSLLHVSNKYFMCCHRRTCQSCCIAICRASSAVTGGWEEEGKGEASSSCDEDEAKLTITDAHRTGYYTNR